jgi:DNA invertase Pin-like site-specific DNA recombinase
LHGTVLNSVNLNVTAPRRCALYLRVSTDRQNCENQRPALEQLAAARGLEVVRVYEEQVSAVAKHRPEWEAVKAAAHRGEFQVLVVFALDRVDGFLNPRESGVEKWL